MGRPGKALRDHWQTMRDDPAQVAERIRHREAGERAHREMLARFGTLTAENAAAAIRWQAARIDELTKESQP